MRVETALVADVDALADAIITLLEDDALRGNMERRIREDYFVGEKSWKVIAEKYLEFYPFLLNN